MQLAFTSCSMYLGLLLGVVGRRGGGIILTLEEKKEASVFSTLNLKR